MLPHLTRAAFGWLAKTLALSPDLKHLDDGVLRWHFGDDPQDGADLGDD